MHFTHTTILSNKCDNGIFINEVKNVDYLLKVTGDINEMQMAEYIKDINSVPEIITAFVIELNIIKDKSKKRLSFLKY